MTSPLPEKLTSAYPVTPSSEHLPHERDANHAIKLDPESAPTVGEPQAQPTAGVSLASCIAANILLGGAFMQTAGTTVRRGR